MAIMTETNSSKRSLIVFVRFPHVVSSNEISNLQIEEVQSVNFIIIGFQELIWKNIKGLPEAANLYLFQLI